MVYLSYKAYQQDHVAYEQQRHDPKHQNMAYRREHIYKYIDKSEIVDIPRGGSHAEGIGGSTRTSTSSHGVQISALLEVVNHSRCRKMFAVPTPYAPQEEDDGVHGSGKKMSSIDGVERSSRVVAPQKPNCPHTPSRVLRRTRVPEAPALPWFRARGVTGQDDSRAAEK
jgi:hypothetical protein